MAPILRVDGINKSFAGNQVLHDISFSIQAGQVHSLVGENGAGKSTLMKIIGGIYQPDSGSLYYDGQSTLFNDPWEAMQNGIAIVHQELSLVPNQNVAQNIFVRREKSILGFIRWKKLFAEAHELFDRIGVDIDPTALVADFSVGMQQIIEIAKALSFNAKVIIMDEPTSALSENEVERLYTIVNDLKAHGVAIVFISHKLGEVFRMSDEISVLRDGHMVGTVKPDESSRAEVIQMMVGRQVTELYPDRGDKFGDDILVVDNFSNPPHFDDINFTLRRGEIPRLRGPGRVGSNRGGARHLRRRSHQGRQVGIKRPSDSS